VTRRPGTLLQRLGWFVLLWLAGVLCVTVVGYVIRLFIGP